MACSSHAYWPLKVFIELVANREVQRMDHSLIMQRPSCITDYLFFGTAGSRNNLNNHICMKAPGGASSILWVASLQF